MGVRRSGLRYLLLLLLRLFFLVTPLAFLVAVAVAFGLLRAAGGLLGSALARCLRPFGTYDPCSL